MKAVFLFAIVVVVLAAVLVPETEAQAQFVRNLGRSVRNGFRTVRRGLTRGVVNLGRAVRRGAQAVRRGFQTRGKRSALALTPDTVNALDKVSTFNLGLPAIRELFIVSDENKNAFLDGQEVFVFLGMIESLRVSTTKHRNQSYSEARTLRMSSGFNQQQPQWVPVE